MQGRVQVDGQDAGGGCAITTRAVVTAAHVVRKVRSPSEVTFVTTSGDTLSVSLIEADAALDLAVLHLSNDAIPSCVSDAAKNDTWEVKVGPVANDPYLSGFVDFATRQFMNDQGGMQQVLQLRVLQEVKEYEGFSGSAVTLPKASDSVVAVLTEQQLERTRPRPDAARPIATNVLYAVPIEVALHRFGLADAATHWRSSARTGVLYGVPDVPIPFITRSSVVAEIRDRILSRLKAYQSSRVIVLHGMPGVGKSVLAAAVLRDQEVRQAFFDGLVWIPIGMGNNLIAGLRLAGQFAGDVETSSYIELPSATARLTAALADRTCLLVLDDVWRMDDIVPFLTALGDRAMIIATTRDYGVVSGLDAEVVALEQFDDNEAKTMLAAWAKVPIYELPGTALKVAYLCGNLPLTLALCGALVREGVPWPDLVEALEEADLEYLASQLPNYSYSSPFLAIQASVDHIRARSSADVQRLFEMSVFMRSTAIPESAVTMLWCRRGMMRTRDARKLLKDLATRALLRISGVAPNREVSFHDLIWDFLGAAKKHQAELDAELVDAYSARCPDGWHSGPDDGYFFQYLPLHLKRASKLDILRGLVLDPRWSSAQLRVAGVSAAIVSFGLVADPAFQRIGVTLRLARVILDQDPSQLAEQLLGRLLSSQNREILTFLNHAASHRKGPWLRPLAATLRTPDGPLGSTVYAHLGGVFAFDLTPDGTSAVTLGLDGLARIWNLTDETELGRLHLSDYSATSLAMTQDGKNVIIGTSDGTVQIWDAESGKLARSLINGTVAITALAVGSNGIILAGAEDGAISLWRFERTESLFLGRHNGPLRALAISVSCSLAASAASDNTTAVWDLNSYVELRRFEIQWVTDVALTPDDHAVVVAIGSEISTDGKLVARSITNGECIRNEKLEGELYYTLSSASGGCTCIDISRDGLWVGGMGDSSVRLIGSDDFSILTGHLDKVVKVRAISDSNIVSASADGTIRKWRISQQSDSPRRVGHVSRVDDIAISRDCRLAVTASWDHTLQLWDPATGMAIGKLTGHTGLVRCVVMAPDASWIASAGHDGMLRHWDLLNNGESRILATSERAFTAIAMSPDGGVVIVGGDLATDVYQYHDKAIQVWDTRLPGPTRTLEGDYVGSLSALAITPDSRLAVGCASSGDVVVWDLSNGEQVARRRDTFVRAVALLPDSKIAFSTWGDDTVLRLWNLMTGDMLGEFQGHTGRVNDVAVAQNGLLAVSCGSDQRAIIWDLVKREIVAQFYGDTQLLSVAMSVDGHTILVGEATGAVHTLALKLD